jgi:hypothetical protein
MATMEQEGDTPPAHKKRGTPRGVGGRGTPSLHGWAPLLPQKVKHSNEYTPP